MLKIRRPLGRLIFNMGIAIPGKTVFLIETAPCCGEDFRTISRAFSKWLQQSVIKLHFIPLPRQWSSLYWTNPWLPCKHARKWSCCLATWWALKWYCRWPVYLVSTPYTREFLAVTHQGVLEGLGSYSAAHKICMYRFAVLCFVMVISSMSSILCSLFTHFIQNVFP